MLTYSVRLGGLDVHVATLPQDAVENLFLQRVDPFYIFLSIAKKPPKTLTQEKAQSVGISHNKCHIQVQAFHVAEGTEQQMRLGLH